MPAAVYASKTSWQLQMDVSEGTLDAVNNRSFVSWALYLYRGNSDTPWNNSGSGWSASAPGGASGTFPAYRFGGTGTGTNYSGTPVGGRVLIASGGDWVTHNPDGTGSTTVSASHAAGSTLGTASIGATGFGLTTLKQAPGVPTSVVATRISDTQVGLTWTNNHASNGAPTTNEVQVSVNGGAFGAPTSIAAATSLTISAAANQKIVVQVRASNAAGTSAWSASSAAAYTTPAAPTAVVAAKNGAGNIEVSWAPHVAFTEHTHVVEHGTISGGVTTWDGSPLGSVSAGTSLYTHSAPNPAQVHVYRVSAKNTDVGALSSATVLSNSVQLLIAPNAPTLGTVPAFAAKTLALDIPWVHNPADTTAQTAYEFSYSTNGGSSWTSTGKVTSTAAFRTIAANAYAAGVTLTVRVRTWGQATTGGSEGTGASPWSATKAVTFKTRPTVSITSPANASTVTQATLTVVLAFAQAEAATFVQASIELYQGATLLEQITSTTLAGTTFATKVLDGVSYTVKATVLDSNGLTSTQASSTFSVDYTNPVTAVVVATYLDDSGIGQLDVTIPAAGGGAVAAVFITITRTIGNQVETIVDHYPVSAGVYTFLDITPTIHGLNEYTATTFSVDGATALAELDLETDEDRWAFLNTGAGFTSIVKFYGNLVLGSATARRTALVVAAGRRTPIALFGQTKTLDVQGSATIVAGDGSTVEEIEAFILDAGLTCYRDPSGRRMFGAVKGSFSGRSARTAEFGYTVSEAT